MRLKYIISSLSITFFSQLYSLVQRSLLSFIIELIYNSNLYLNSNVFYLGSASLFKSISTFIGYLMPKPTSQKISGDAM